MTEIPTEYLSVKFDCEKYLEGTKWEKSASPIAALMYASWKGDLEIVKHLTEKEEDLDSDIAIQAALIEASRNNNIDIVSYLLDKEIVPKDNLHYSLMIATYRNNLEAANVLIEHGANVILAAIETQKMKGFKEEKKEILGRFSLLNITSKQRDTIAVILKETIN
jgi:ankyrin repeat protein